MSYKVRIESFEGPFDLLLYLVSRQKVDIGAISITEIADQYLAEVSTMKNLDLDVASDFLLVASTLLEIKAASLLPQQRTEEEDEIAELSPQDARDILIDRLVTYKQFKNASLALSARFDAESRMHGRNAGPDPVFLNLMPDFLKGIPIEKLATLAVAALARREVFLLESEHIARKPLSVETYVRSIHERIVREKSLRFSDLVSKDAPSELVVVTFLAILELYKRSMVHLEQEALFGDIAIDYIEGSGALFLDDGEIGNDDLS